MIRSVTQHDSASNRLTASHVVFHYWEYRKNRLAKWDTFHEFGGYRET